MFSIVLGADVSRGVECVQHRGIQRSTDEGAMGRLHFARRNDKAKLKNRVSVRGSQSWISIELFFHCRRRKRKTNIVTGSVVGVGDLSVPGRP